LIITSSQEATNIIGTPISVDDLNNMVQAK